MKEYRGKSVFGGIAIGRICVYQKGEQQVKRVKTEDTDGEMQRYTQAKEAAVRRQFFPDVCIYGG